MRAQRVAALATVSAVLMGFQAAGTFAQSRLSNASRAVFTGDRFCVCGDFPTSRSQLGLQLDHTPLGEPDEVGTGVLYFRVPGDVEPGPHLLSGSPSAGFDPGETRSLTVLRVGAELDAEALRRLQSTTLRLWVDGTDESLSLRLENGTPEIVSLEGGNDQRITLRGGRRNAIERRVRGLRRGDFSITYTLEGDNACPCAPETEDELVEPDDETAPEAQPEPTEPEEPTKPEEPPPHYTPEVACDCCCYKNLQWDTAGPIVGDIVVPSNHGTVKVPLGGQLPLAGVGYDLDGLTIRCERKGCSRPPCKPCPPCRSKRVLPIPDDVTLSWRLVSGDGALRTLPHRHSVASARAAAVYQAPDTLPEDPKVELELRIDDSPEQLTDVDDPPLIRHLVLELVAEGGDADLAPKTVTPPAGSVVDEGECACKPHSDWAVDPRLAAEKDLPGYVWRRGYEVFSASGFDSDRLTAGCSGDCSSKSEDAVRRLVDPLRYDWTVDSGAVYGVPMRQVVFDPDRVGDVRVRLEVQDSAKQFNDPSQVLAGTVTVVDLEEPAAVAERSGDYIVPFAPDNVVRYVLQPPSLVADRVTLQVLDKDGVELRFLDGLPTGNDAATGFAEHRWDGLTTFETPLTEDRAPYVYRLRMYKGEAIARLDIADRQLKEWDFSFRIADEGASGGGGTATPSGIQATTVTPELVEVTAKPGSGSALRVPVFNVTESNASATDLGVAVKLLESFAEDDAFLFYTSPTLPAEIGYVVEVRSQEGGALDKAGNEWDMDDSRTGIQRLTRWSFVVDVQGRLTGFVEEIP